MSEIEKMKEQQDMLGKAIQAEIQKAQIEKYLEEEKKQTDKLRKEIEKIKASEKGKTVDAKVVTDETYFKVQEKKKLFKPSTWFKSDKTNPLVMIVLSPAGDLTIRERVADQRGNLSLGKNCLYRTESREIWDIAESDVSGFKGKRVLFYHQDDPNPLRIRKDSTGVKITVNTETYAKSQKSHLLSELLSPEMSWSDYMTMILTGICILLNLVIIFRLFFMGGATGGT